ncbi:MAG: MMPL family transporter, partial [Myxococcota bacterium]|nr:MMPL family transporter [Myxococcota bacterium]
QLAIPKPIPDDEDTLLQLSKRIRANPLFRDRLISGDGKQIMVWIQMKSLPNFDNQRDMLVTEVTDTVAQYLDEQHYALGGIGVIYTALNAITQRDFGLFISLTYLIMFGALFFIFRSVRLVVATLGVITVGTVFCLGIYGLVDKKMNMVTVLLPTLVIVLGLADAIHFPTSFVREMKKNPDNRPVALMTALRQVLPPCLMTTLTTAAGFLALASSPMPAVRDLGIFAAIGVVGAFIASIVCMVIAFMGMTDAPKLPEFRRIDRLLNRCCIAVKTQARSISVCLLFIVGLSTYMALQLKADTYTLGYLPTTHKVVVDHHKIAGQWGEYFPLEFTMAPIGNRRVDSAESLNAMEAFFAEATQVDGVRNGLSLATVFRRTQEAFAPESDLKSPFTTALVAQLKLLIGEPSHQYEWDKSAPAYHDNVFAPLMNRDGSLARMTLVARMGSAQDVKLRMDKLLGVAKQHFAGLAHVKTAGYPPLYVKIIDFIISSQALGFYLALGLVFALMLIWLKSLRLAFISMIVNIFPVLVMFGLMQALGLTLDIASATIAAIVLGISIDDTIHFIGHWRRGESQGLSWHNNVSSTYTHAGRPATITTCLLITGFPILMFAEVKTVFFFGLLTTVAAFAALVADLLLLPLLLRLFPRTAPPEGITS